MIYLSATYLSAKRIFGARIFVNINKKNKKLHLIDLLQRFCSYHSLRTSDNIYINLQRARRFNKTENSCLRVTRSLEKKIDTNNYY